MLDLYKDSQKEFYNEICNAILKNNKVSHAYFIETSSFEFGKELVLSFAKFLLCRNHFTNRASCGNCLVCDLVDKHVENYIQVIEPDGLWIKKEQLEEVKARFSKKPVDNFPQIYIIMQADKLNQSSANSILKFIEEPEEGIIAILVAENKYQVLPTILSRCQIYTLVGDKNVKLEEDLEEFYSLLLTIEDKRERTICYTKELWHDKYKTKEEVLNVFEKLESIFLDLLNYKVKNVTLYDTYINQIEKIALQNDVDDIIRKIKLIEFMKESVFYNANLSLLIDRFIIDYVGGDKNG